MHHAVIDCQKKHVLFPSLKDEKFEFKFTSRSKLVTTITALKAMNYQKVDVTATWPTLWITLKKIRLDLRIFQSCVNISRYFLMIYHVCPKIQK